MKLYAGLKKLNGVRFLSNFMSASAPVSLERASARATPSVPHLSPRAHNEVRKPPATVISSPRRPLLPAALPPWQGSEAPTGPVDFVQPRRDVRSRFPAGSQEPCRPLWYGRIGLTSGSHNRRKVRHHVQQVPASRAYQLGFRLAIAKTTKEGSLNRIRTGIERYG